MLIWMTSVEHLPKPSIGWCTSSLSTWHHCKKC